MRAEKTKCFAWSRAARLEEVDLGRGTQERDTSDGSKKRIQSAAHKENIDGGYCYVCASYHILPFLVVQYEYSTQYMI